MASNNINDDACCIKMKENQNKGMVDYHFFNPQHGASCNASVPKADATNTYATYQSLPADLLSQESALTGRMTRLNKCNVRCAGGDVNSLENKTETLPEFCPIISRRTQSDYCNN